MNDQVQLEDQILKDFRSYLEAVGHVTNLKEATFRMMHLGTNPCPFRYANPRGEIHSK